jgi:hypothetical protein
MIMKNLYLVVCVISLSLISCTQGYEKKDNTWYWVSTNEGGQEEKEVNAHLESFQILEDEDYAKDMNHVFVKGSILEKADPGSFKILSADGYTKDKNHVFFESFEIIYADSESFKVLKRPYSKDKQHIYCGNIPMNVDNIDEFEVTKSDEFTSYTSKKLFIKWNEEFSWIDSLNVNSIVIGERGEGKTSTQKFKGCNEVH